MADASDKDLENTLGNEVSFKHMAEEAEEKVEPKERDMVEEIEAADNFND
jgi:hypothetical protein